MTQPKLEPIPIRSLVLDAYFGHRARQDSATINIETQIDKVDPKMVACLDTKTLRNDVPNCCLRGLQLVLGEIPPPLATHEGREARIAYRGE